jgi:hypothetical protein
MTAREYFRPRCRAMTAGGISLLLIFIILICGCLQTEPEELSPQEGPSAVAVTESPAIPASTPGNISSIPPVIVITSPKQVRLFTEQNFPPAVNAAITDFAEGRSQDSVNGYLRWESVRTKTSLPDKTRIQEQIHSIDYAMFNTTLKENVSVYVGISGEQAKRILNDSAYSDYGYAIASYDPSVVYHRLANSGRDNEGYLTMCVIDYRKGNHLLLVNATEKEFLLPRGGIWDVAGVETYERLEYSADSIPRYEDMIPTKVRLIHTKEHP